MRFKVNGADIMTRGANWIPLEELDGRNTDAAHVAAVQSAAAANMNIMRIWGGGTWPPESFFDACDAAGVLLYVDVQYASARNGLLKVDS
jgi:beta-mannosidase